jgi:hypothetical protein
MRLQGSLPGAALAALLLAPPAFAQDAATATSTIGNFGYELVDLLPNDGIAPSVQLSSGQRRSEANLLSYPNRAPVAQAHSLDYASVEVNANGSTARSTLAPSQARTDVSAVTAMYSEGFAYDTINFVLSPHARLIFSGDAHINVQQNLDSNVYASAKIFGEIPGSPFLSTRAQFSSSIESALGENEQMLSVAVNSGAEETAGYVQFRTDAGAVSRVPAIPEPSPALMLCAGLGLLAVARGRRRIQVFPRPR